MSFKTKVHDMVNCNPLHVPMTKAWASKFSNLGTGGVFNVSGSKGARLYCHDEATFDSHLPM